MTTITRKIKLVYEEDKGLADYSWKQMRVFMDLLTRALESMPEWPGGEILPIKLTDGTVGYHVAMPQAAEPAFLGQTGTSCAVRVIIVPRAIHCVVQNRFENLNRN